MCTYVYISALGGPKYMQRMFVVCSFVYLFCMLIMMLLMLHLICNSLDIYAPAHVL